MSSRMSTKAAVDKHLKAMGIPAFGIPDIPTTSRIGSSNSTSQILDDKKYATSVRDYNSEYCMANQMEEETREKKIKEEICKWNREKKIKDKKIGNGKQKIQYNTEDIKTVLAAEEAEHPIFSPDCPISEESEYDSLPVHTVSSFNAKSKAPISGAKRKLSPFMAHCASKEAWNKSFNVVDTNSDCDEEGANSAVSSKVKGKEEVAMEEEEKEEEKEVSLYREDIVRRLLINISVVTMEVILEDDGDCNPEMFDTVKEKAEKVYDIIMRRSPYTHTT